MLLADLTDVIAVPKLLFLHFLRVVRRLTSLGKVLGQNLEAKRY